MKRSIGFIFQIFILIVLAGCNISGTIKDTNGTPVQGAIVYLTGNDTKTAVTDKDGKFRFTNMSQGTYSIQPGNYGPCAPESYDIEKHDSDIKNVDFVFSNVTRIGLTYGAGPALSRLLGIDVHKNCREALQENNGIVVTFSVFDSKTIRSEKLHTIDGVLIPGGVDIDPARYGEKPHENLEIIDKELDELEFTVLDYAEDNHLPIFGICRGHQVINVFYGGTLYQDIPSQYQAEPSVIHRDRQNDCFHDIDILPGTWLSETMEAMLLSVNSMHHQAVKDLASGFTVSAVSPDNLTEGIERAGENLVIGVQFHPEIMRSTRPEFDRLFEMFVNHAREGQTLPVVD
ncbi:MAG: gamma-glutamyl-gamma-aminobutyrate hydrolase family protein [Proteobacteria bacterium]|nr:gamma-glutamyl-gamma-aminobutyrate hydrolase family protein [Pseudomonadota bacterium]